MRIICPKCTSHYEVEDGLIAAMGQLVRCAECREVWLASTPQVDVQARTEPKRAKLPSVDPSRDPIDFELARQRLRPRRDKIDTGQAMGRTLGGLVLALLCGAVLTATLGLRTTIVERLPATSSLYAAVGFGVNPQGLALQDVRSALVTEGDKTVLTLQGRIANLRDGSTSVPALTVVVRGADETPLYSWTAPAPKTRLAKGEMVEFRSRLAAPPASGQDVRVSFAEARDALAVTR